ncbi:MAG: DNA replication/repair protein RecF, partial [Nevskiales bacterium]
FLDWGVFHVEHGFYPAWLRYQRALRQRNHALRTSNTPAQATAWDTELVQQADILDGARRRYLTALGAVLPGIMRSLFDETAVSIEFQQGWPEDQTLAATLRQGIERDRVQGHTQAGPHRADLKIRLQGRQARARASRGEQKLISAGLLLAQADLLRQSQQRRPVLLIDDLAAELDTRGRARLFSAIHDLGAQSFLSFLEPGQIPAHRGESAMFHVEHGRVRRTA